MIRIAEAVACDRQRERRLEVPARVHVLGGHYAGLDGPADDRDVRHRDERRYAEFLLRPVQKVFGTLDTIRGKGPQVLRQSWRERADRRLTVQQRVEFVQGPNRTRAIIVLRHAAGRYIEVLDAVVGQDLARVIDTAIWPE